MVVGRLLSWLELVFLFEGSCVFPKFLRISFARSYRKNLPNRFDCWGAVGVRCFWGPFPPFRGSVLFFQDGRCGGFFLCEECFSPWKAFLPSPYSVCLLCMLAERL